MLTPRTAPRPTASPFATIPGALRHWATQAPDRNAVVCGEELLSYAALDAAVTEAAAQLIRRGVVQGDRVVLAGHNSIAWVIWYLATLRMGAVVAPANNRLSPGQFLQQAHLLEAALVLRDPAHAELTHDAERAGFVVVELALPQPADVHEDFAIPAPDAPALISFTSGTTGDPKGAVLTHENLLGGSRVFADVTGSTHADSTLVLVPLFHNTGFVDQLGHMLVVGGQTNLLPQFKTAHAVAELAQRPVTFLTAVPSILRLLMVAEDADAAFGNAHTVLFGGSPMPAAWTAEMLNRWPHLKLIHGYGLTEFTSACSFLPPALVQTDGESVGYPAPGVRLRIVDGGADQPSGSVGEVWAAGPTRMTEYWRAPELTAAKLEGEWLRTGDLGYLDERGLLWLTGRIDDVINRGGEKILPSHVESCLAEVAAISDAAVFGVDDPILQQRVAAALELRPGGAFDEQQVRAHLAARLPDYAIPESWFVLDQLPRTASGKVDRRAAQTATVPHSQENTP
jgi:long-chain acyl-CoA synthetase